MSVAFDYDIEPDEDAHIDEVIRLTRDLREAAETMGDAEARYLVDAYYQTQENRKRTNNQLRSLGEEPHVLIEWLTQKNLTLEKSVKAALDIYTQNHMMDDWMRNITGIGPVLTAGLLAHIYMDKWCSFENEVKTKQGRLEIMHCRGRSKEDCAARQVKNKGLLKKHKFMPVESTPTVGHIWSFAGIAGDGQKPWEEGHKRPWNAELKTICWKVGQSFMKLNNHPDCYYGHIYKERKFYEIGRNESGDLADRAAQSLPRFKKTTESYKYYVQGKLPPAHIDARARRYAVKLFLAHMHEVWYQRLYKKQPPLPYPIAFLGHAHYIPPPNQA